MLQFIFGRAATGKTSTVLNLIKEEVSLNRNVVLIIPEQFSFESEKAVLHLLGDEDASKVEVLSFSRLCESVERLTGGICARTLSDADKLILMCRAVNNSADSLKLWGKYKNSLGFAKSVLDMVNEFKLSGISPEELINASSSVEGDTFALKLYDIGVIYSNFNILVGEKFLDPSDRLTKLYDRLLDCRYFENKTVFIDSFDGFTGQQFKIINRILSQAENIYISFSNSKDDTKFDVFENIRNNIEKIKKSAELYKVQIAEDIILENSFYKSENIAAVEELLSVGKASREKSELADDGAVTVIKANTLYDEVEFTARQIRKLVRENAGLRYRDIVVIARETENYEEALVSAFEKNKVSCFIDKRRPLACFPPVAAALCAISAATNFSTDSLIAFYKIGLTDISLDRISKLENYTYIWNISGKLWDSEWTMNPKGMKSGEMGKSDLKELEEINKTREQMITLFKTFKEEFKGSAADRAKALIGFFDSCNVREALKKMKKSYIKSGDIAFADALTQSFDIFMNMLDSMVVCMGEGSVTSKEFADILKTSLSFSSIGVVPQKLDEVTFGSADRIRPSRPKVAFVLGANQNVFPRTVVGGGLFANRERDRLIKLGLEISDHSIADTIDEEYLVYANICCPTEKLYVSYHIMDNSGKQVEPSGFVEVIKDKVNCKLLSEPSKLSTENLPETVEAAFSEFCKALSTDSEEALNIGKAIGDIPSVSGRIDTVKNGYEKRSLEITKETAYKLFGDEIRLSPSKLETFMCCSFSFFCKYGLKATPIEKAEFNVMQRGTIVHYVLERIISEYKASVAEFSEEQISSLVDLYTEEYLDSVIGYRKIEDSRLKFLVYTIKRSLREIVAHLSREFAQSGFEPVRCELYVGGDEVDAAEIELDGGKKISVQGFVDRVDMWNNYIRIVDYKTGTRKFKLPDILAGQNMQMLIYLYSILKDKRYSDKKPAGIFYMPARRDLNDKGLRMDGLAVEDNEVSSAMEAENKGEFVTPLKYNKGGDISSHSESKFISADDFEVVFAQIERMLYKMGSNISEGNFRVNPVDSLDNNACKYCDFASVCGIEDKPHQKIKAMKNKEVIEAIREEMK